MAFVYEKISAEKGQELFEKYHFMQQEDIPVRPRHWVVDTERSAFMIAERGQAGETNGSNFVGFPARSVIIWNEEPTEIEFYHTIDQSARTVHIHIKRIGVLPSLGDKKDEITELVKEALLKHYQREEDWPGNKNTSFIIEEVPSELSLYTSKERKQ